MKKMFRYPVDFGAPVELDLRGDPVAFATQPRVDACEFWAEHDEDLPPRRRTFQVFGTGWDIPPGAKHWGTAPRTADGLVWHLYEVPTRERPFPGGFGFSGFRL